MLIRVQRYYFIIIYTHETDNNYVKTNHFTRFNNIFHISHFTFQRNIIPLCCKSILQEHKFKGSGHSGWDSFLLLTFIRLKLNYKL